ncbi:hypothetical protein EVAR_87295_1 [Eumeta japonica]|uniref:Uncharacterized protein n=1 Tax=Eumeta variegata TaxID=151549 RepID=A0A4C1VUP3_EUMVA|nr:hypothetical protein EVAR_87295_1 [Eumeta japonica]
MWPYIARDKFSRRLRFYELLRENFTRRLSPPRVTTDEYGREMAASIVGFRLVSESYGDPLPLHRLTPFTVCPILTRKSGDALVTALRCAIDAPSANGFRAPVLYDGTVNGPYIAKKARRAKSQKYVKGSSSISHIYKYQSMLALAVVAFRPMSENSGGPPASSNSSLSIKYVTSCQEAGRIPVSPLKLRVFMGGRDHQLYGDSHARLTHKNAI